MIPGNGVGGVVVEVGNGVDEQLLGRRVVTGTGGQGGYAKRVAVDAHGLIAVPGAIAMDAAVALLADGRTATALFQAAGVAPGERVLVEAGAGGAVCSFRWPALPELW
jgi:NADPH2:quinone reductase